MSEKGTAFSTDDRGGLIAPDKAAGPVSYDAVAIANGGGRAPREHESVVFDRAPGSSEATSVRVASSANADLTKSLRSAFERGVEADRLSDDVRSEVVRLAANRAARARRANGQGAAIPHDVLLARIALATAAMTLLAVEARGIEPGKLTAVDLRETLRRQRPPLPR